MRTGQKSSFGVKTVLIKKPYNYQSCKNKSLGLTNNYEFLICYFSEVIFNPKGGADFSDFSPGEKSEKSQSINYKLISMDTAIFFIGKSTCYQVVMDCQALPL